MGAARRDIRAPTRPDPFHEKAIVCQCRRRGGGSFVVAIITKNSTLLPFALVSAKGRVHEGVRLE